MHCKKSLLILDGGSIEAKGQKKETRIDIRGGRESKSTNKKAFATEGKKNGDKENEGCV